MKMTRTHGITFGAIILLGLLMALLFEIKEVPNVPWNSSYNYKGKEARDTWLLHELLDEKYNDVTLFDELSEISEPKIDSSLIIYMGKFVNPDELEMNLILDKIYDGAKVLFAGESIKSYTQSIDIYEDGQVFTDSISMQLNDQTMHLKLEKGNQFGGFGTRIQRHNVSVPDLMKVISVVEGDYFRNSMMSDSGLQKLDTVFICYAYGQGQLCLHYIPFAFTNIASQQSGYLQHFNHITSLLTASKVWLKRSTFEIVKSQGLLKYIFAQRAFKWAYYLLLITTLIYLVFASKRKQKSIPLVTKKENSSLEFIESVSRVIQSKKRNDRLVIKMKNNFDAYIENRYYIYQKDEQFKQKLIKKSKISEDLINKIFATFKKYELNISDKDVAKLYKLLNEFYKKSEK